MSARVEDVLAALQAVIEERAHGVASNWAIHRAGLAQAVTDELVAGHGEAALALLKADRDNAIALVEHGEWPAYTVPVTLDQFMETTGYKRARRAAREEH